LWQTGCNFGNLLETGKISGRAFGEAILEGVTDGRVAFDGIEDAFADLEFESTKKNIF